MKVQVLEIKPMGANIFEVDVVTGASKSGKRLYTFPVEVQETKIGDQDGLVASGGRYVWETLQYNARVIGQLYRLVLKVYNGSKVSLPTTITEDLAISSVSVSTPVHTHHGSKRNSLEMRRKSLALSA